MNKLTIQDFFTKRFEEESTDLLLEDPFLFSRQRMEDYLCEITSFELKEFIQYIINNPNTTEVTSADVTQLSSIEDCTINMCKMMSDADNRGLTFPEIAKGLHIDGKYKDNLVALLKYGENQVKTSRQFGLTKFYDGKWYLTSVGMVLLGVTENVRNKYLAISILRDPLFSKLVVSLFQKDTVLRNYIGFLSESTIKRRTSSCKKVLSFIINQCMQENLPIHKLI